MTLARAGRSPRGVRRGQLHAPPGARLARVCSRSVCWGSKGLRPVTSRPQHRKTELAMDQGSRGRFGEVMQTNPPISEGHQGGPGTAALSASEASYFAVNQPLDSSVALICDLGSPRASIALTARDLAARAPLRGTQELVHPKPAKHRLLKTQPWARAASASPSSSLRRTRIC